MLRPVCTLIVLLGACASCAPPAPATIRFEAVGTEAGFRFRHEIPAGRLDNLPKAAMGGLAVLDVDGDGLLDLYFVNGGWHETLAGVARPRNVARNRLLANQGGMTFRDVTEVTGTGDTGFGMGVCVGDIDNDGRPDMFVSNYGTSVLYRNKGDGVFEDVTAASGIASEFAAGAAFLDYDRDGLLDLFVSQYIDPDELASGGGMAGHAGQMEAFPPPAAYAPQPGRLYRGLGDGRFEDVTLASGVGAPGKGMGVVASDVDDDGWIDLVVANDTMANFVWKNRGDGTFTDVATTLGMAYGASATARGSMGVNTADVDGDGALDYLIPDTRGGCVYLARDGHYSDRSGEMGFPVLVRPFIGWTDAVLDADLDGRLDVFKTHGDFYSLRPQESFLLRAQPDGIFDRDDAPPDGVVRGTARGAVAADLDNDGLEDLVVLLLDDKARLLRNATQGAGNWARVRLEGTRSNRMALGARVWARVGERRIVREVSGSSGYLSAGDTRVHVALGRESTLRGVRIRWPSGSVQEVGDLGPGDHVIREP